MECLAANILSTQIGSIFVAVSWEDITVEGDHVLGRFSFLGQD